MKGRLFSIIGSLTLILALAGLIVSPGFYQPLQAQVGPQTSVVMYPTSSNPCANPFAVMVYGHVATSGTAAVQLVALTANKKIHVCDLSVVGVSGTNPTFSLVYGTGTNCGTGQTVLLDAQATAAATQYRYTRVIVPAGKALCYLDGGTTPIQNLSYTYIVN